MRTTKKKRAEMREDVVAYDGGETRVSRDVIDLIADVDDAVKLLHLSKCIGQNPDSNADFYCWMQMEPEEYCPRCTFLQEPSDG